MRLRMAKFSAERAGIDYKALRLAHRATWKWRIPGGEWQVGVTAGVSVRGVGWDVTCKCGWESRTGGAIRARVEEDHERHVWDVVLGMTTLDDRDPIGYGSRTSEKENGSND